MKIIFLLFQKVKIKDNVDLKELEKFGFKLSGEKFESYIVNIEDKQYINHATLIVTPVTRKIIIDTGSTCIKDKLDILYDLIKANLVEKVKKEE